MAAFSYVRENFNVQGRVGAVLWLLEETRWRNAFPHITWFPDT
jgi:hypothetical protein